MTTSNTDDIVDELLYGCRTDPYGTPTRRRAAAEIERLRAENEKLRDDLSWYVWTDDAPHKGKR